MTVFTIAAVGMTLFALAVLLPVLWRNSENNNADLQGANVLIAGEQLEQLNALHQSGEISEQEFFERRTELELALASSLDSDDDAEAVTIEEPRNRPRGYVIGTMVAVGLPVAAFLLYRAIGTPQALDPVFIANHQAPSTTQSAASIDELLPRLEAHLANTPDDLRGWRLLGVTYLRMQRYDDADSALTNAMNLAPDDVDILLQLADAKAMRAGGKLQGEPQALVKKALELRPDDPRGLWLMGMFHKEQGAHAAALQTWEKLVPLLSDQPEALQEVMTLANESRSALGVKPTPANSDPIVDPPRSIDSTNAAIAVNVGLSPDIKAELKSDHSVFIYAKAIDGPPMPLAVSKKRVSDLPVELILDDNLAMVAGMNLSSFESVVVGARVSMSGNPVAQSGDYFVEVQPVKPGQSAPVLLNIESKVP